MCECIVINASITQNHHGEVIFIFSVHAVITVSLCRAPCCGDGVEQKFKFDSHSSPLPPHHTIICSYPLSSGQRPPLMCESDKLPPKQLALESGFTALERMTSFPLLPSFRLSLDYGQNASRAGEINSCMLSSITETRHIHAGYRARTLESVRQQWTLIESRQTPCRDTVDVFVQNLRNIMSRMFTFRDATNNWNSNKAEGNEAVV